MENCCLFFFYFWHYNYRHLRTKQIVAVNCTNWHVENISWRHWYTLEKSFIKFNDFLNSLFYQLSHEDWSTSPTALMMLLLRITFWKINSFQPSVAFHLETIHLFCWVKQMTGFYMKCNIVLKSSNFLKLFKKRFMNFS